MKAALQNYHARLQRVIDYIDQHLDGDLDLETVSRVAAFSKFHFHRQFTATFELSVHRYVQLARMKRASHRLASETPSVTDIAMDAGYDAPDAFARDLRVVRASLCPACPYEACFAPAGLGDPKRHGHSDGCRLRCTGCLRPRLSSCPCIAMSSLPV